MSTSTQSKQASATVADTIHDTVFFIEGITGNTLDVFLNQAAAIKEYITYYKAQKIRASLCMLQGGRKYQMHPTGTAADYSR